MSKVGEGQRMRLTSSAGKGPAGRRGSREDVLIRRWVEKARQLPDKREELIRRVSAEIDAGTYESPEKLKIAIKRLLEDL